MKLMMLNLTEVMPGGCPGSETLKSRDCVTGDSYFASFHHTGDHQDGGKKHDNDFI